MHRRDIIVIGCSAGGVQALTEIVRGLPHDLPAALLIVMHTSPSSPGILPQILDRAGPLPAEHARDGDRIRPGRIYVAPPDHHLIIRRHAVRIVHGPRENGFRPAVDPLFRTAAHAFGRRVIGVILSGGMDDGTEGLMRIKTCGGSAVVQDPDEAVFPSMPAHAIRHVECDHVLPLAQIPPILTQLAKMALDDDDGASEGTPAMSEADCPGDDDDTDQLDMFEVGNAGLRAGNLPGPPSAFTCPECGGALWELSNEGLLRYRCHVGHAYAAEALATEHARKLEGALWTALRALEENSAIRRRMAERSKGQKWASLASEYERQAKDSEERAALIREVLVSDNIKKHAGPEVPRIPDPQIQGSNTQTSSDPQSQSTDGRPRRGRPRGADGAQHRRGNGNGNRSGDGKLNGSGKGKADAKNRPYARGHDVSGTTPAIAGVGPTKSQRQ